MTEIQPNGNESSDEADKLIPTNMMRHLLLTELAGLLMAHGTRMTLSGKKNLKYIDC